MSLQGHESISVERMLTALISKKIHNSPFQNKLEYRLKGNIKAAAFILELVLLFWHLFSNLVIMSCVSICANIDCFLHAPL